MSFKSLFIAIGMGLAGLTLSGCVSEDYYGGGYSDPYYVRGGYIGTGVVFDNGGYYNNRRYPRYYRDSRYRDHRYRDRRPDYQRPERPRPPQIDRPRPSSPAYVRPRHQAADPSRHSDTRSPDTDNSSRAYIRARNMNRR